MALHKVGFVSSKITALKVASEYSVRNVAPFVFPVVGRIAGLIAAVRK